VTPFDRTVLAASFGDRNAIDALARSHHRELVAHALRACENQHDAEDAVQEFWLALLEKRLTRFPPETGRAGEWMRGVVECLALGQRIERWYAMRWHEEDERPTAPAKKEV
jgi:DNA-directed RNA polymerase specialized sigma24 family protein